MFQYGKNSRRDRFTDEDLIGLDGSIDESVPGSTPGSANGLRASTRWEHPAVLKEPIEVGYHIQLHYLPDRNVRKLSRVKRFESSGLVVWLNMV